MSHPLPPINPKERQTPGWQPIAIIGVGCRFPGGVHDLESYWQLLRDGIDAIQEIPSSRFNLDTFYDSRPATPGKVMTRFGGFLEHIDELDAYFFGISPREAERMDPQQRLLLETAWEALEDAGQPLERLLGSQTGVFVGQWLSDYEARLFADPSQVDFYMTTGSGRYTSSGRLSYFFGLQGPSLTADSACSSSLVAVHLACQSLRTGESRMALAGAANVILQPHITIAYSQSKMMAPDGRCKFGDARANGYVRSEGAAVIVLKRLADALADGDPILALIIGSAVNNDGQSSGFLATPGGAGQEEMLRKAYHNAGIFPGAVQYVEAHGTGTSAGDPVEIGALGAVLGEGRSPDQPCRIGSVKSNFGHTEGAAGLAGLIKVLLSLKHQQLPPSLHYQTPNPTIPWDKLPLRVQDRLEPWPEHSGPALAGVSAFGIAGTNAHIVLQEAPAQAVSPSHADVKGDETITVLTLSARSAQALAASAGRMRDYLETTLNNAQDILYTANLRRTHLEHRMAVTGSDKAQWVKSLAAHLEGVTPPTVVTGQAAVERKVVFVFPGQGSQWVGMGRLLLQTQPVFRETIQRCEQAFRPYVDWSLTQQLQADETHSRLSEIDVVQPILFAIEVALAELWIHLGIRPSAVVGHSMGEVAAAYIAGALNLEDAARVICTRSRLMKRVSGKGAMTLVELTLDQARAALEGYDDLVSIAVSNGPKSTVLAGDPAALEAITAALQNRGVFCRPVKVDVAAHSPHMDALRPELEQALTGLHPQAPAVPIYSTVTGKLADSPLDPAYWGQNLRQPVLFSSAVDQLRETGVSIFVECSPHPILLTSIEQNAPSEGSASLVTVPSMRRGEKELDTIMVGLGRLFSAGFMLDWRRLTPEGRCVVLPSYPWQRKHYWLQVKQEHFDPTAKLFYQVEWQVSRRQQASHPASPGTWLVFTEGTGKGGLGDQLSAQLQANGKRCIQVTAGRQFSEQGQDHYTLNPLDPEDFRRLITILGAERTSLQGIAYLWGMLAPDSNELTTPDLAELLPVYLGGAFHLVQVLASTAWQPRSAPRLWLVTRNAQPVAGMRPVGLAQAPLWGFGRVVSFEHSDLWGGLVDVDDSSRVAQDLAAELLGPGNQQSAYRQGLRYAGHIIRASVPSGGVAGIRPDASYLITGGLGGIGLQVAGWLASQGARHIALMGRSRGSEAARQAVKALENSGVQVLLLQGDASRGEDVDRIMDEISHSLPPLRGIVHSAGTVEDALLVRQDWSAFERVMGSKVLGTWNLHLATRDLALDWFVLFSSVTDLLGTPSQANYTAANAFLDAFAYERRAGGLPALSINWGAWTQVGLAAQQDRLEWLARLGIESFSPEEGLAALGRAFHLGSPQIAIVAMDWDKFLDQRPNGRQEAFFAGLGRAEPADTENKESEPAEQELSEILHKLEAAATADRINLIRAYVQQTVAAVLRFENPTDLAPDQGFLRLGIDSLMAVELKNRLQKGLGQSLRTTLAFDYPSVNLLSHYLLSELFSEQPQAASTPPVEEPPDELAKLDGLSREDVQSMLDDELRLLEEDL